MNPGHYHYSEETIMDSMSFQQLIVTRTEMARAVLGTLLAAMDSDSPPTDLVVQETISAAIELLELPNT